MRYTDPRTHALTTWTGVAGTGTEMPPRIQTSSWKKKRGRWLYAEDWVSRVRRTASDSIGYYAAPSCSAVLPRLLAGHAGGVQWGVVAILSSIAN